VPVSQAANINIKMDLKQEIQIKIQIQNIKILFAIFSNDNERLGNFVNQVITCC
jgi:hypothetical protein